MRRVTSLVSIVLACAALPGAAAAQGGPAPLETTTSTERQMTLPASRVLVQTFVEVSLSDGAVLEPLSIAPDLWLGVNDQLSVGLVHSGRAATGFFGGAGNGLCATGSDGGCAEVYDNVGLAGRYHFYRDGELTASAEGGLFARSFDPFTLALAAGAVGRWQRGRFALDAAPRLFVGLTEREPEAGAVELATTNRETLYLPVTALFAVTPALGVAAQTGAVVPFEDAGDLYSVAVSIGGQYMATRNLLVDLAFSLPAVAGGDALDTGLDARSLTLGVGYVH